MPHISIEYSIMVPVLLVQVILFPLAANWLIDTWVVRRREVALQDIASHVGSTIQQLYFSLNREEIGVGITNQSPNVPLFIESSPYIITPSSRKFGDSTIIDLHVAMMGVGVIVFTRVTLGPNVMWTQTPFVSNSTDAGIMVEKFSNGTLSFSFT